MSVEIKPYDNDLRERFLREAKRIGAVLQKGGAGSPVAGAPELGRIAFARERTMV